VMHPDAAVVMSLLAWAVDVERMAVSW